MRRILPAMAAVVLGACGVTSVPTPTPGSYENFVAGLVQRGATVTRQVAGDTGCPDPALHRNAARFDVTFGRPPANYSVYLFTWRRQGDYDAAGDAFERCVRAVADANPDAEFTVFGSPPLRTYGGDWPPELSAAVELSLRDAIGR